MLTLSSPLTEKIAIWMKTLYLPIECDLQTRRHDLDGLRVIVFGLLILFHIGMFYVENWGWHIKSEYRSQWLENIMLFVEPWRMPIIWFISGAALKFILAKMSFSRLIIMRSFRLLLPLLFGVLVVVPPQLFIEMTANNEISISYWQFMIAFFSDNHPIFTDHQAGIWPHIDVNHLWYLRSLWRYSLLLILLLPLISLNFFQRFTITLGKLPTALFALLLIMPIFFIQVSVDQEIARYPLGFSFMLYGYLFGWQREIWQKISEKMLVTLICFILCYICFVSFYNLIWLDIMKGGSADDLTLILGMFGYATMRVIGLFTLLGLGIKLLSKPFKTLPYFSEAIFPYYILHQTLIIVFGYHLSRLELHPIVEVTSLLILTIVGCILLVEMIKRIDILRPFFGLKIQKEYSPTATRIGYSVSALLILPLVFRLLF